MAWIRQHKSRVHRLISAMLPCLSVAVVQPHFGNAAVQPRLSHILAMQPRLGNVATSRHLKIGWFRVIKGDGLEDSPPAD